MLHASRGRRRSIAAVIALSGLLGTMVASTADAGRRSPPAPSPARCNNRNNNTERKLLECVTLAGVREHQSVFQLIANANGGTRSSGTPGYDASVDYAERILRNAGYDVTVQPFEFEYSEHRSSLVENSPVPGEYTVLANAFTPFVGGTATGDVIAVDVVIPPTELPSSTSGCEPDDFAGFPDGAIALVQRGTCDFVVKARNADEAGAAGVIVFNEGQPGRDGPFSGIGDSTGIDIPVVFADFATGEDLYAQSVAGAVNVTIVSDQVVETRIAENVIAESRRGNDNEVIMVGAHLDSVIEGAGINDNGSGAAALLEVAENLRKVKPNNTIRFALWGAEEFGLLGSEHYVANLDAEAARDIALYLNFDMIGSPNYFRGVYDGDGDTFGIPGPPGSAAIEEQFERFYAERGLAFEGTEFSGRSDYGPFIAVGIPAGGLFTGAEDVKTEEQVALYGGTAGVAFDPCYHQACDDFDNVALDVLDVNADAMAAATLKWAKSTRQLGVGDANRATARTSTITTVAEPVNQNRAAPLIPS